MSIHSDESFPNREEKNMESDQARWAHGCNRYGDCPICNFKEPPEMETWAIVVQYSDGTVKSFNNEVPEDIAVEIEQWLEERL